MSFAVDANAYDLFMGRYSSRLAPVFAAFAKVSSGLRAVDIGCGPGALTTELVRLLGAQNVVAADPSEPFVTAARARHPEVTIENAAAEALPFADDEFDRALAQLVVMFMADPARGIAEMRRVTRPGGEIAVCVWDHGAGGQGPLSPFWSVARELHPDAVDESALLGAHRGDLSGLLVEAGLTAVVEEPIEVSLEHATFAEWWEPYTYGVGPVGSYLSGLDLVDRHELERRCRMVFPAEPFVVRARAWACRGVV